MCRRSHRFRKIKSEKFLFYRGFWVQRTTYNVEDKYQSQNRQLSELKRTIEERFVFGPDLFVGLTYRNEKYSSFDCFQDFLGWGFALSKRFRTHIQPFAAVEETSRKHLHAILNSEHPIDPAVAKRMWNDRFGMAHVEKYDPSQYGVQYIYNHHEAIASTVLCPHRSGACRRGKCKFRTYGFVHPRRTLTE